LPHLKEIVNSPLGDDALLHNVVDQLHGFVHERCEQGLAVLGQLHHAGEHVHVLVGLTGGAAALAIDFHDEQLRVNLGEHAFALDDLRAAHVGAHLQSLTDEIIQGIMNAVDDLCLLGQIH
jgi:hypothetical protein